MSTDREKAKRWRLRWSVRTLVIVVTLGCAYLACWGPTKRYGLNDVETYIWSNAEGSFGDPVDPFGEGEVVLPFVVWRDSHYYIWFFGHVAKLPESKESLAPHY